MRAVQAGPVVTEVRESDVLLWMSGATALPLYHMHPHIPEECLLPDDVVEQTRRILETFTELLAGLGVGWSHVVKVSAFLTNARDLEQVTALVRGRLEAEGAEPAVGFVVIDALSSPGARLELELVAVREESA